MGVGDRGLCNRLPSLPGGARRAATWRGLRRLVAVRAG